VLYTVGNRRFDHPSPPDWEDLDDPFNHGCGIYGEGEEMPPITKAKNIK
jgi:hypothetical protein